MRTNAVLRNLAIIVASALPATATTTFNWSAATLNVISSQHVQVTGNTSGDDVLPYTVDILTTGSILDVTFAMVGNYTTPININHPATRNSSTQTTVTISFDGGVYLMVAPSYTLFDVDASAGGGDFSDWQDRVTVGNAGSTLTSVNPAFNTVTALTVLGMDGNVANDSTNGNVNVSTPGTVSSITFTYGPGPSDGFDQNQRIGISNIVIQDVTSAASAPEPGSRLLMGSGLIAFGVLARRRRRRK